jgi:pilus assembly protein Flp/PilA
VDEETALADDRGATAIEYALIAALIAVSSIAAMQGVGARIITTFMVVAEALGFGGVGGVGGGGAPPIP